MQARDRLIVALDVSSRDDVLRLVDELRGAVGMFKIGLQAFIANGPAIVRDVVSRGERVFLDLKIHDIPNTAMRAVAEAGRLGVSLLTVHATGGAAMLRAAAAARVAGLELLGVTVLTSLDDDELTRAGFRGTAMELALRLAALSREAGIDGVVASPLEIAAIRETFGGSLRIVTPGIRPAGSAAGDQRRTMTPADAIAAGADMIVVGRPITGAESRRDAALRITDEIAAALQ
ncbi:MAG TPA: orotidine-5'-phosphate decarboxylase [Thermoanaerobaculia bacterium]|nr:orotidine-5'-phosphate decarboxylase [Thermoanaerobaculia bacterium]